MFCCPFMSCFAGFTYRINSPLPSHTQLEPPPSRVVTTDGDDTLLPLLRANTSANITTQKPTECMQLVWGAGLPDPKALTGNFDLVVAADAILAPPLPQYTKGSTEEQRVSKQIDNLLESGASLLDPSAQNPPACMVLSTAEPLDRLKAPKLRSLVMAAAERAGLQCMSWSERTAGVPQPNWLTDVLVFELSR